MRSAECQDTYAEFSKGVWWTGHASGAFPRNAFEPWKATDPLILVPSDERPPKLVIRFLDTTYEFSRTQRNTKHTGRAGVIAPPGELLTAGETTHLLALRACMGCSICRPVSRSRFRPLCVTVPASACGSRKGFRPARRRRICWRPGIVPGQLVRS
jgi:hypothetical protein